MTFTVRFHFFHLLMSEPKHTPEPKAAAASDSTGATADEKKSARAHVMYQNGTERVVVGVRTVIGDRGCYQFQFRSPPK